MAHSPRLPTGGFIVVLAMLLSAVAAAADLQDRTSQAYAAYLQNAEARFLAGARAEVRPAAGRGTPQAQAAHEDGIIGVPGGLVHHWSGSVHMPGGTLRTAVEVSQRYSQYQAIYKEIVASRLIEREGDTFRVLMRLKEGEAGVTAVLDVRSTVKYTFPAEGRVVTISNADEIREVQHAGGEHEQLLPAGRDSGYLWRANVFTLFVQMPDGVYVRTETLGLSRGFPPFLGWFIEPIARRLGRKSVERSLEQFQTAVREAHASAGAAAVGR